MRAAVTVYQPPIISSPSRPGNDAPVTRPRGIPRTPRPSLYRAGAPARFLAALALAGLLWIAIRWALA